jgi:hypothetical protein
MSESCIHKIERIWQILAPGQVFKTPDFLRGANFSISNIVSDRLKIRTKNDNIVSISKDAFVNALYYLNINGHDKKNPCEIRSSTNPELAGPLCRISRQVTSNVRCINYILPILASFNLVAINGNRPNTTWLLKLTH